MTENLTSGFDSEPSETDLNLGIKRPLLAHKPLGRKLISPKFLLPLGAKALSNFDPSIFLNSEAIDSNILDNPFQDSPFFSENKATKFTSDSTIIQHKLESSNSDLRQDVLLNNNVVVNLSPSGAIANIDTPKNPNIKSKFLQTQIDNHNSVSNPKTNSSSTVSQPPKYTSLTTDAESKFIQTKLDSNNFASSQEIESQSTTSQTAESSSSATGIDSTVIPAQLDKHDSVVSHKIESQPTTSQIAESSSSATDAKSTIIQPRLDSNNSIVSPKIESLSTTSQTEVMFDDKSLPVYTTSTNNAESKVIQKKSESHNSIVKQNIDSLLTASQLPKSESPTAGLESAILQPQLDSVDSTIIQSQLDSNDSVVSPKIENLSTQLAEHSSSITGVDSAVVQPQLDSNDSVVSPKIENLSTQLAEHSSSITGVDSTIIQLQLDSNDSVVSPKIENQPTTSQAAERSSSTADVDSTVVIQPQLDSNDSVVSPKIEKQPITFQPPEHASSTTGEDSTIIQPQLDNYDSVVSPTFGSQSTTSQPAEYSSSTTDADSTIIQLQLESNDSVASRKIDSLSITSLPPEHASSITNADSAVVQPQLNSNDSVPHQPAVAEIDHAPNASIQEAMSDDKLQSVNALTTTSAESTIIQPTRETHHSVSYQPTVAETNLALTASTPEAIALTTTSAESTIIQPTWETHHSATPPEAAEIDYLPTTSSQQATFSITQSNTAKESTIIQPKLESNNSFFIQEAVTEDTQPLTTSTHEANEFPATLKNTSVGSKIIQPQLDSNDSVASQKIDSLLAASQTEMMFDEKSLRVNTSSTINPESTLIQPKLDSNHSIAWHKTDSLSTASQPPESESPTAGVESAIIQAQLESHNSVSHQPAIAEIDYALTASTQQAMSDDKSQSVNAPSTTVTESTVIQPKLESHHSVSHQPNVAQIDHVLTSSTQEAMSDDKPQSVNALSTTLTSTNTGVESTIIPAKLDSNDSVVSSQGIKSLSTTFQFPENSPTNTNSDSKLIQAKIDSNDSVASSQKINNLSNISQPPEHSSSSTGANSTIIQAKINNNDSVVGRKIESLPTTSQLIESYLTNTSVDLTVIQPQLDNNDSIAIQEINNSQIVSTKNALAPNAIPNITNKVSKNTLIQQKKAEQNYQGKAEIPQLPKALKNISIFYPLSQSSDFISSTVPDATDSLDVPHSVPMSDTPAHYIQKEPEQDIPNSWSSIAELFGESKVNTVSPTMVVQPLRDKKQGNNKLKPLQYIKTLKKADFSKNVTSRQFIQASPETSTPAESIEENYSNSSTNKDSASEDELENLNTLAREVYKMLKQRLDIERERRGNNYSGRLPW
ncbi:ELKS/Rab6-interacting/CAST family protein [Nostoc sp. CHAB 5844]|nr:ELKS/Rab6-interacting/CAST family protein [Nostoc sp. CHAB 5844]